MLTAIVHRLGLRKPTEATPQTPPVAAVRDTRVPVPAGIDPATQAGAAALRAAVGDVRTVIADPTTGRLVAVCGSPTARPGEVRAGLDPGVRATAGDRLAELARNRGLHLVELRSDAHVAFLAALDPFTAAVRDRIAALRGCRPWDIELDLRWKAWPAAGGGPDLWLPSLVRVIRQPTIADPDRRIATWRDLAAQVLPASDGYRWLVDDNPVTGMVTLRLVADPLQSTCLLPDFARRFRSTTDSYTRFPVAIREDGGGLEYTLFHTLVVGQTGAGKGSVLWSVMSGLLPAAREGLVEFYAIDPKNAEAKAAAGIFEEIAVEPDQWDKLLERLVVDLKARQAVSGRSFEATREKPLRLLFIDELSALAVLDSDRDRRARVAANLLVVLSQGRSDGNIVLAAVQAPQKEMIGGQARNFFPMRIALRTETPVETNLVLGDGSTEQGAAAHLIPPANPGNGYRTAGIGFARVDGESRPVRVRFPYTDDATLAGWSAEFAALFADRRRARANAPAAAGNGQGGGAAMPARGTRIRVDGDDDLWA